MEEKIQDQNNTLKAFLNDAPIETQTVSNKSLRKDEDEDSKTTIRQRKKHEKNIEEVEPIKQEPIDEEEQNVEEERQESEEVDKGEYEQEKNAKPKQKSKTPELKIKDLEEQLRNNKKWGHENREILLFTSKKVKEFMARKLEEGSPILEEDYQEVMDFYNKNNKDLIRDIEEPKVLSREEKVSNKLIEEFNVFKKYSRIEDLESKFNLFFAFYNKLLSPEEQKNYIDRLEDDEPEEALKYAIDQGEQFYELHHRGIVKNRNSIKAYLDNLATENIKKDKKIKELEVELDESVETVYTKPINLTTSSRSNTSKYKNALEAFTK